jgi:hypothetical protein
MKLEAVMRKQQSIILGYLYPVKDETEILYSSKFRPADSLA